VGFVGDGEERVCAVSALVDTVVAEAPVAFHAIVAFPVAVIGEGFAERAEDAFVEAMVWVVFTHEDVGRREGLSERREWSSIAAARKDVWLVKVGRIASLGAVAFVECPSCPAKAEPVLAALSGSVAAEANVIRAIVAFRAVVVEFMLDVVFCAVLAGHMWLAV